ncbi:MAG: NAD(P)-dependent oxidoreductase [Vulcanimicrobiaceae bacterium]|jgi:3-hydroxyisobutyrate dehydrogenase
MSLTGESVLFIGAGNMGGPMATHLLDAGVQLAVADLSERALEPFAARGVPTATSAADLPGDVVITMLPADKHVREALLGTGGAIGKRKRSIVIEMTSAAPTATKRLAAELYELGIPLIDAPVSGGVRGAKGAKLTTMVGGDEKLFERYSPLLALMCSTIRHVGAVGSGHTLKALNNFLSGVSLWATCEALLIGAKSGLDLQTMVDVIKTSSGQTNALDTKIVMSVLPRTFDYGFSMRLISKDISIAARLARELDVPAPVLAQAEENWMLAKSQLGEDADFSAVMRLLETWADYELPKT